MFTRKNILSISCPDLASSLNDNYGIKRNDYHNPNYVDGCDILNALSCEQEYGSRCFIEISISQNDINEAIEEYRNANLDDPFINDIALRMRALSWLREHVPLDENSVLLEINY